ncbi:MAG TPA: hypothetical protein VIL98_09650 [Gaiellaceae bacterium]
MIERMRAIEMSLPARDGVAWFTRLYLACGVRKVGVVARIGALAG